VKLQVPYSPPEFTGRIELELSRNEGRPARALEAKSLSSEALARYPDLTQLRAELARRSGLEPERVLVTAGADDALLRTCLATLGEGRQALLTRPTFEMIPRYVELARGTLREVDWPEGTFPTEKFLAAAKPQTAVAFIVSPNNPTGAVASAEDVERIAAALPNALVVLDAAYGEFADDDLTSLALRFENVVVMRTLSKAWGLAGLRIGYALGSARWIERLAACGNPFPVSAASEAIALRRLATGEADMRNYVERTRVERNELTATLARFGARVAEPSEANFVLARGLDARWTTAAAASLGVALRRFPDNPLLEDAVRVTLPGDPRCFERLSAVLEAALAPEALLFDLDGVLADVSRSYRAAIIATARCFGVSVSNAEIDVAKQRGDANDDWALTRTLLLDRGRDVPLAEVTLRFEEFYQGTSTSPGLREREELLVPRETIAAWRERFPLAVVTGRPRADAQRFLERFELSSLFDAVVCREDAPLKPAPEPVRRALGALGVRSAWMLGDTSDDLAAARAAGVVPIGVVARGADASLTRAGLERAGAARVLDQTLDLEELLP